MINEVQLTQAQFDFLRIMAFGRERNSYLVASDKAYFDLCRTIRYMDTSSKVREKLRATIAKRIESAVCNDLTHAEKTQAAFDKWQKNLCLAIEREFLQVGVKLYIGQCQKWVNMAMKYLYVLNDQTVASFFSYLHVPMDQYIYQAAEREFHIKPTCFAWSRIDSYDDYYDYQTTIRAALLIPPMEWEFSAWAKMATGDQSIDT